ncbi:chromate efflux transporter [Ralstonia pseudosolanacearum]
MPADPPPSAPPAPTRAEAFRYWLRLGFISFGGPAGQIAILHEELVERRRWISEARFLHALNYCMVLPGPEAQQLATYIGWLMHRTWGGVVAGGLFVLPSLLVLIALSYIYARFGQVPAVAGVLYGIKPAVTAIVVSAAWRIGSRALRNAWLWGIAAAAFVAIFVFAAPFPAIVLAAALIGVAGGRLSPHTFQTGAGHAEAAARGAPAVIDNDMPTPPHARFSWRHVARVLLGFLLLWAVLIGVLAWRFGWSGAFTQMGVFFTQAALLTFGGAYAVLPYVFQGAVEHYHWLTAPQMIDGLALGETTPGPLIMVVAFVGYLGGWGAAVFGPDAVAVSAALGATVATVFTFLPSFLFILLGGPFVESTHGNLRFTAPLSAITAAVVGVIVNLAVFFAVRVLWPDGWGGHFDGASAAIGLAAGVALFRYRVGVIPVILGCGAAGLAMRLLAG